MLRICFILICTLPAITLLSQTQVDAYKNYRNTASVTLGLIDRNLSYERSIIAKSNSQSYLRGGFGYVQLLNAGEGRYINLAFVQLFGKNSSHIEVNGGFKIMITNSIEDPSFGEQYVPEVFVGYRYQKPSGRFMFRAGFNYPTVLNLGLGVRF